MTSQVWYVHFDNDRDGPRKRQCATEEEAFKEACGLRQTSVEIYIEGPNGESRDKKAIAEWCRAHGK